MTYREFYTAVANANISTELTEFATKAIAQLDHKNENRKSGNSKSAKEAQENRAKVINVMTEGTVYTAKSIAEACGFETTQRASGILTQLVKEEKIGVFDYTPTGKKKDVVKGYFVGEKPEV